MQRALLKAGFTFAGELQEMDEGDQELFYFERVKREDKLITFERSSASYCQTPPQSI